MPHSLPPDRESSQKDIGYHMAGLPLHDERSALKCLANLGYRTLVLVPRRTSLHHDHPAWEKLTATLRQEAIHASMRLILDLDGLFVSNPTTRTWPSLASSDEDEGMQAVELCQRWIRSAAELGVSLVTFSSGSANRQPHDATSKLKSTERSRTEEIGTEVVWDQLGPRIGELLRCAQEHDVMLAVRPAAGNAVSTTTHYETLLQWIDSDQPLHLAADVDAMIQGGEFPIASRLIRHLPSLCGVFLETSHFAPRSQGDLHLDVGRLWQNLEESGFEGPFILRSKYHLPSSDCPPGLDDAESAWRALNATRSF